MSQKCKIPLATVLSRVMMVREVAPKIGSIIYRLPQQEKLKIETLLKKLKDGYKLNAYEKEDDNIKTSEVLLMETDEGKNDRKRKLEGKTSEMGKEHGKLNVKKSKKIKKAIDVSNPNRMLRYNPDIEVLNEDPLFEGDEEVPFVSSLAHSKLAIRAVLTDDMKLLADCKNNNKQVHSIHIKRYFLF